MLCGGGRECWVGGILRDQAGASLEALSEANYSQRPIWKQKQCCWEHAVVFDSTLLIIVLSLGRGVPGVSDAWISILAPPFINHVTSSLPIHTSHFVSPDKIPAPGPIYKCSGAGPASAPLSSPDIPTGTVNSRPSGAPSYFMSLHLFLCAGDSCYLKYPF